MISLNSIRPFCWFHTYYLITTRFRINNAKISRVIILLSNRTLSALKCPVYKGFQKIFCQRAISFILFWGKVFILLMHEYSSKIMKLYFLKSIPFDFPFPQILFFSDFRFPHKIQILCRF